MVESRKSNVRVKSQGSRAKAVLRSKVYQLPNDECRVPIEKLTLAKDAKSAKKGTKVQELKAKGKGEKQMLPQKSADKEGLRSNVNSPNSGL